MNPLIPVAIIAGLIALLSTSSKSSEKEEEEQMSSMDEICEETNRQRDMDEILSAILKTRRGRKIFQGVISESECACKTVKESGEEKLKILFSTKEAAGAVRDIVLKDYNQKQRVYPCKNADGKILGYHLATINKKRLQ